MHIMNQSSQDCYIRFNVENRAPSCKTLSGIKSNMFQIVSLQIQCIGWVSLKSRPKIRNQKRPKSVTKGKEAGMSGPPAPHWLVWGGLGLSPEHSSSAILHLSRASSSPLLSFYATSPSSYF